MRQARGCWLEPSSDHQNIIRASMLISEEMAGARLKKSPPNTEKTLLAHALEGSVPNNLSEMTERLDRYH